MSTNALDLTGQKFNRLTAIRPGRMFGGHCGWIFKCDCGAEHEAIGSRVAAGYTKSCGCLAREGTRDRSIKHGKFGSPTYSSWSAMHTRCFNPNNHAWLRYGGRGITVCERWLGADGFANFLADMGERPSGLSLDRIDNDGNYEPGNCKWSTRSEQSRNRGPSGVARFSRLHQPCIEEHW